MSTPSATGLAVAADRIREVQRALVALADAQDRVGLITPGRHARDLADQLARALTDLTGSPV